MSGNAILLEGRSKVSKSLKGIAGFPHRLLSTRTEEEVKSEFSKTFKIKLDTSMGMDLYTDYILFEFKYDSGYENIRKRARVIAQLLYYVKRLQDGKDDYRIIPPILCGVDKNGAFFVSTAAYGKICENNSYDWERAPSTPAPEIIDAVSRHKETQGLHVYDFSVPEDFQNFIQRYRDANTWQIRLDLEELLKKSINENTFHAAFELWNKMFEEYVRNGTKPSEYFLADIREGGAHPVGENQVIFEITSQLARKKHMPMSDYHYYWSVYQKCNDSRAVAAIRQKMDRLTKEDKRRFTGEFYTPIEFAKKAIDYLNRTVGEKWWDKGYRLWDMAAGTGNLEYYLPEEALPYCYISTLLPDDVNYLGEIFPRATVFEYDYLNDDVSLFFDKPLAMLTRNIPAKMPRNLQDDLENEAIKWIIFINPPFATSNDGSLRRGVNKDSVSFTEVRRLMTKEKLGETSRELFSQFLWRINREFGERQAFLGMFSKIKYINAHNDQKMRERFFDYCFKRGFVFPAKAFHGTKGQFPVGFLVWDLSDRIPLTEQTIEVAIFDEDVDKIGQKTIPSIDRTNSLNSWVPRYRNTGGILPPFSSAFNTAFGHKDIRDRVTTDFLASCVSQGNDFQHQKYSALLSAPYASAGAFSVTPANFERAMILLAVRLIEKATWLNDRDQFLEPGTDDFDDYFISDCVVWALFSRPNETVSFNDIEYGGKVYQIQNNMYPFLLSEVHKWKCSLSTVQNSLVAANSDRFAAKWLSAHRLSREAQAVITVAKEIYKGFYANLGNLRHPKYRITSWDAGFCQIRRSLEEAGIALDNISKMHEAHKSLGKAILPRIYEYGFLSGKQVFYADEVE